VLKAMLQTPLKTAGVALFGLCLLGGMGAGLLFSAPDDPQDGGKKPVLPSAQKRPRAEDTVLSRLQKANEVLLKEVERLREENEKLTRALQRIREEQGKQAVAPLVLGQDNMAKPSRPDRPRASLTIKVYPVAGLTAATGLEGQEARSLMRVLANTIDPQSWKEMGGEGSMEYYPEAGCLVIRQTAEVHQQVRDLLDNLRRVKKEYDKSPHGTAVP
jgi:hypothetical protein